VWAADGAIVPLDPRLAQAEADALIARVRPTVIVDGSQARRDRHGIPAERDAALVMATSGSTGAPRLAVLGRTAVEAAVRTSAHALGATPADPWLLCLPVAHIGGMLVLLRGHMLGAPVIVHRRFDARSVAGERRARYMSLVPALLRRLLASGRDLSHLQAVLVGGDRVDPVMRDQAAAAGVRVVCTYGQTESCGGVVYDGVPLPGISVRISANDEIELHGATLMSGYRLDAAATAMAFTADGWLRTGDAGSIDAAGLLMVRGRIEDMVVSGGEKVWPAEVEAVLRTHPGVAQVAVVARSDPDWGQRVVAVIVPASPGSPPQLDELRDWVGQRLARYKAPREVLVVEQLPRTALGKVHRPSIQAGPT